MATLAFVHAHPDDEALLTAGTMARAVAEGHRVVLVTATDGSAGLAGAEFQADLAAVRERELAASAAILGVHAVHSLGFADSGLHADVPGGFVGVPVDVAAAHIADLLTAEEVDVLVGYDSSGGYGHPDHVHVHAVVRALRAHLSRPTRLFEATLPREPIYRAVRLAATLHLTPRGFDPDEFAHAWTPRREITHRVDTRRFADAKRRSMRAHASQASADDSTRTLAVLSALPRGIFSALLGTEYYVEVT